MIYLILFIAGWNIIIAMFTSRMDAIDISNDKVISLKSFKLPRAIFIAGINVILAFTLFSAYEVSILIFIVYALYGQIIFGIFHNLLLNIRRFKFTSKAFLYTSNDGNNLNDSYLDRFCNIFPYPVSGYMIWIIELSFFLICLHILLK